MSGKLLLRKVTLQKDRGKREGIDEIFLSDRRKFVRLSCTRMGLREDFIKCGITRKGKNFEPLHKKRSGPTVSNTILTELAG